MILTYNLLQLLLLPLFFIPLLLIVVCTPKYRSRSLKRLGFGLKRRPIQVGRRVFWIHALSVGEVTSALPLIAGIRKEYPDAELFFSASSLAGAEVAEKLLHDKIDYFIAFPFDIRFIINHFLRRIQPDIFILVETDFWPNILSCLQRKKIQTFLVNGRISERSFRSYKRFTFFFRPMFSRFTALCMQTEKDRQNLIQLGVQKDTIHTPGNLKYDTALYSTDTRNQPISFVLPEHKQLIVAGSTHPGEEEILLKSYIELKGIFPDIYLIIAPRNIDSGAHIHALAHSLNLSANRRSQINAGAKDLFILDTIGELNSVYSHADIAFVGGSLVAKGGHNPI